MNHRDLLGRNTAFQPHGQLATDISNRMEPCIKGSDFIDRLVDRTRDFKEGQIFRADEASIQQLARDKAVPVIPIAAAGSLEADNRLRIALAGLREGQDFEAFVMGAKAAGKERARVGFLLKNQFSGEERLEGNQYRIVPNRGVGTLLKRQHDVHAEAVLPAGSFLGGAHDAVCSTGDDHKALFDDPAAKVEGNLVVRVVGCGTGRSKNTDLFPAMVVTEYAECMAELFHCSVDDFEVERVEVGIMELEHACQDFLHQCRRKIVVRTLQERADLAQYFVV